MRRWRSESRFESRLVWIFGSPRSGSTWLLDLLVHPLAPADESPLGAQRRDAPDADPPQAVPINEPYIPHHLAPALADEQVLNERLPAVTVNALRHGTPNYFFSDRYERAWKPDLRRLLLGRLEAQARAAAQAFSLRDPLVIVKEPNGSLGADFVMSLLPQARLIFLLRDGRDIVDSMVDAQAPGGWLADAAEDGAGAADRRLELVCHEARMWLARTLAVERAYEAHAPARRLLVRYEDLRSDAAGVLASVDRWLGLERGDAARRSAVSWNDFDSYPAEIKGRGRPLRVARPGMWRENLTAQEQEAMTRVIGSKLAELGYRA